VCGQVGGDVWPLLKHGSAGGRDFPGPLGDELPEHRGQALDFAAVAAHGPTGAGASGLASAGLVTSAAGGLLGCLQPDTASSPAAVTPARTPVALPSLPAARLREAAAAVRGALKKTARERSTSSWPRLHQQLGNALPHRLTAGDRIEILIPVDRTNPADQPLLASLLADGDPDSASVFRTVSAALGRQTPSDDAELQALITTEVGRLHTFLYQVMASPAVPGTLRRFTVVFRWPVFPNARRVRFGTHYGLGMMSDEAPSGFPGWGVRLALWLCTLVTVPLYLWFLAYMGNRWGDQLPAGDDAGFWLPIVVPGAAFSFTVLAAMSWWWSGVRSKPFLMGRSNWRFLVVFVAALSMAAGVIGSADRDVTAVVLTATITMMGIAGLWLLPAAISPEVLRGLSKRGQPPSNPS